LTCDLSGSMASHSVGYKESFMLDIYNTGILVGIPYLSLVAPSPIFNIQSITPKDYVVAVLKDRISCTIILLFANFKYINSTAYHYK
jgi:hypothetical protein